MENPQLTIPELPLEVLDLAETHFGNVSFVGGELEGVRAHLDAAEGHENDALTAFAGHDPAVAPLDTELVKLSPRAAAVADPKVSKYARELTQSTAVRVKIVHDFAETHGFVYCPLTILTDQGGVCTTATPAAAPPGLTRPLNPPIGLRDVRIPIPIHTLQAVVPPKPAPAAPGVPPAPAQPALPPIAREES